MHRHRRQLTGRLESCWQDHAPWADSPTHPITKHVISKMRPQLHYRSQTRGRNIAIQLWLAHKWLWNVLWVERGIARRLKTWWASLASAVCVMWTAGNGITFVLGREDNPVTPDNSLAMNRNRPCQATSASVFSCTPPTTHSPNHSLPFPHVRHLRRLLHRRPSVACVLHWFGSFY